MSDRKLGKDAEQKFEEAKNAPDKTGFLNKKGAKRKNWNKRWFILKDNFLFYCKTQSSLPQGIINLKNCSVGKLDGPTAKPHSFSLMAVKSVSIDGEWTNRTYYIHAEDEKEMEGWIQSIKDASSKYSKKTEV